MASRHATAGPKCDITSALSVIGVRKLHLAGTFISQTYLHQFVSLSLFIVQASLRQCSDNVCQCRLVCMGRIKDICILFMPSEVKLDYCSTVQQSNSVLSNIGAWL